MINLQNIVKNIKKLQNFQGECIFSESMKKHTTFKVGGNAQVFATPENENSLRILVQELIDQKVNYFILGGGSNIVVSDSGIEGFVISTEKLNTISLVTCNDGSLQVRCESGCTIEALTEFCIENALTGLESFAGLPGTVGGALYMNARCYDFSISDVLASATYTYEDSLSTITTYTMNKEDWDYKKSPFQQQNPLTIILSADFNVTKGNKNSIQDKCSYYISDRKEKGHFTYPCAGSVFKNNRDFGKASGQIIDSVGLKGFTIGNAQVAPWHGNLIINLGSASADTIKELVTHVQKRVQQETGKKLECEILFVGKFYK